MYIKNASRLSAKKGRKERKFLIPKPFRNNSVSTQVVHVQNVFQGKFRKIFSEAEIFGQNDMKFAIALATPKTMGTQFTDQNFCDG